jgi:hypothetical protein
LTAPDDPLMLDVRADLDRVDRIMTQVIADPATAEEFIHDPSGVLTRLGLHARTSRDVHDRTNRLFYATLTNSALVSYVADHFQSFQPPADDGTLADGLRQGEIRHSANLDEAALDHCLRDPQVVRRIMALCLHDLNNHGLLQSRHSEQEIDDYIERVVEAITERRAIRDMPVLEAWDSQYGIGKPQGGPVAEVVVLITVVLPVEIAAPATVLAKEEITAATEASRAAIDAAFRVDPQAVRTLATVGALTRLAGELLQHAYTFER